MKTMEIFEPSMCCSAGVGGVDTDLLRVATNIKNLNDHGVTVIRYNLNGAPQAFIANKTVAADIQTNGTANLPLVLVDGKIVITKRYPTDEEFCALLKVPYDYLTANACCEGEEDCCCCGESSDESNDGCCGGSNNGGGCCCC